MGSAEKVPVSPFASVHERLLANGYSVLPISPLSKAPSEYRGGKWRPMTEWQRYRDTPASGFILRAWSAWPEAGIGILTGTRATATHIVACVDYDSDDPDVLMDLERAIPPSPVKKRGKRGFSAFYLVPNGTPGFRTSVAELLTDTRQTVIPPSIHPDTGHAYQWTGTATLLDTPAAALPVLTEDDLARFRDTVEAVTEKPLPAARPVVVQFPDDEVSVWRRLNNTAFANLDAWVPELGLPKLRKTTHGYQGVAFWRESTTGREMSQRSPNLSIMTHKGARDFGSGSSYSAIDLVQVARGIDLDAAFDWLSGRLGLGEDGFETVAVASAPPKESSQGPEVPSIPAKASSEAYDPETGEIVEAEPEQEDEELPDRLTRVPGLLGEVVEWVCNSNRKPNRVLALGTGLGVIGTLVGGGVAGPTRNATHLYIACIAPSGVGKEYPKSCCGMLLNAAKAELLNGPSSFRSHSAVVAEIKGQPVMLCGIDELGSWLKQILSPKASAHESEISSILRELWGKNFMVYRTPAWAQTRSEAVHNPGVSIYGSSTMDELFESMTGRDVFNGFLNRWLLLPTKRRMMSVTPEMEPGRVPKDLAERLKELRTWAFQMTPEDQAAALENDPGPRRQLRWGTRAEAVSKALEEHVFRLGADPGKQGFYARTHEMAIRLATIRAAGNMTNVVQAIDMEWGRDVAMWASDFTLRLAHRNLAENDYQRNYNRVRNAIADARTITMRDLRRRVKGLREQEWKDILQGLQTSEEVRVIKKIPPAGGTPSLIYEYSGD